jgi:hypothetical protein
MGLIGNKTLHSIGWDLAFLAGSLLCCYGLSLAYRPLGFIVGGLELAAASFLQGYWASRRRG